MYSAVFMLAEQLVLKCLGQTFDFYKQQLS